MKKILGMILVIVMAAGTLAGCSSNNDKKEEPAAGTSGTNESQSSSGKTGGNLVVYSACNEEILSTLIPMFEEQTGIKVEVLTGGVGELLKRVQTESDNPYCDVTLGGTESLYLNYIDEFQEYVSPNDEFMLEGHKSYMNKLTPINMDSAIIMWNTNLIGDIEVNGYEDLLQPELFGKIALPDPATSGNGLSTIADFVWLFGNESFEDESGWEMVRKFVSNLDGKVSGSSGNAHKSVADGENTVTVTYEGAAFAYLKNEADIAVTYPSEGVCFGNAMMGIVNNCNNLDNAKLFVDFITSKEVQDLFGTELMSRPVREGAATADFMIPIEEINTFERDPLLVSENSEMLIERYNEIYADVQE